MYWPYSETSEELVGVDISLSKDSKEVITSAGDKIKEGFMIGAAATIFLGVAALAAGSVRKKSRY